MTAALAIDGLGVVYDHYHALKGVSLRVEPGESFGLVGESGSGKSTLLRAIAGLAPVSAGTVAVGGETLGPRRDKAFHRKVQMVFQDPYGSLHPRQTVDRLLLEPLAIHGFANAEERIVRALDEVGLGSGFRFRYPHQLSGGQRQRVASRGRRSSSLPCAARRPTSALTPRCRRGAEPAGGGAATRSLDLPDGQPRSRDHHPSVRPADGDA